MDCVWVRYCDLLQGSSRFDQRFIATDAIMVVSPQFTVDGGETFLYLPECNKGVESFTLVDETAINDSDENVLKPLRELLAHPPKGLQIARFRVIITGKYFGPDSVPKYGHLAWASKKITLLRIERLEPVDESVPGPLHHETK